MAARQLEVLLVVPSLERGGAERVVVNLANGLAGLDVTVQVVATGRLGPLAAQLDASVGTEELRSPRVRGAIPRLLEHLRRRSPDVVLATHTHLNLTLCALRPLIPHRTRLVLREPIHAPVRLEGRSTRPTRLAQRLLYRRSDAVIASSSALASDLARLTGANVLRLENPIDAPSIRSMAGRIGTDERPSHGRSIVSIGRLVQQKAMSDLIKAFEAGSSTDDRLEIIGEGPERDRLESLVARLGLAHRVSLPGLLDDHWRRLAEADALVLASRAEGMPNAVLEALALGTPTIVTTDLTVLDELRAEVGAPALTAVSREHLAEAISGIDPRQGPFPGPSSLPERFSPERVVATLLEVLVSLVDGT